MAKKSNKKQWQTEDGTIWDVHSSAVNYALKHGYNPPVEFKETSKSEELKKGSSNKKD